MSRNPTRAVRLTDELDKEFLEYRDRHDMTNAEALRSLLRDGLRDDDSGVIDSLESGGWATLALSLAAYSFEFGTAAATAAVAAAAMFLYVGYRRR